MSSDMQLKKHVEDELSWEPGVNAAAIGVAVEGCRRDTHRACA